MPAFAKLTPQNVRLHDHAHDRSAHAREQVDLAAQRRWNSSFRISSRHVIVFRRMRLSDVADGNRQRLVTSNFHSARIVSAFCGDTRMRTSPRSVRHDVRNAHPGQHLFDHFRIKPRVNRSRICAVFFEQRKKRGDFALRFRDQSLRIRLRFLLNSISLRVRFRNN